MSVRGARVHGKAAPARAILLAALVALPVLLTLAPPAALAQSSSDPWWGPSDRTRPTEGWAVRVPVTVRNDFDYPLWNHTVAADLDFGALLAKAGWTTQTTGATSTLRGFTLDVDSIRVVEYGRGFATGPLMGGATKLTPHRFYEAPFHAARHREFDAARNPAGTVLFVAEGLMQPGEARSYYVYANPLEFRDTPPASFRPAETAPLDAYLWGSRGTVHYGYEPQQPGTSHKIVVKALHPGRTTVTLSLYTLGRYTVAPASADGPNPIDLSVSSLGGDANAMATFFVPSGTAFKVVGTRPIVVAGHGVLDTGGFTTEAFGWVPSASGSYAGSAFDVYGFKSPESSFVTVTKATPGVVTVSYGTTGQTVTLSAASPSTSIPVAPKAWTKIKATGGEILVSLHPLVPRGGPVHAVQVPALSGGPVGTGFYGGLAPDGGFMRLCAASKTTLRVIDYVKPSLQIHPEGVTDSSPPAVIEGGPTCTTVPASAGTPPDILEFYATKEDRYPVPGAPVPFSLVTGAGKRVGGAPERGAVGHLGGAGAVEFHVEGRIGVFGHFNDTRLFVTEERIRNGVPVLVNRSPLSVSADGFVALDPSAAADATGRWFIRATKPVGVASLEPAEHAYARFVPGRPADPTVVLGQAEFRGPLVELKSPDTDARQLFRSTGPGNPLGFRLDVLNLGRWMGGEGLADTFEVTCEKPEGWKVDGCDREVRLESRAAERLNVLVTPPADDVNATKAVNVTAKSRSSGVSATFKLLVYVEVKYGVGLWFDVEGGRKSMDPPVGVDPAGTHRYNIVVKNTGSTADTFLLGADAPAPGWTQRLLLDGEPVTRVTLDGGESRVLHFLVTAPDAETAPQNIKSVSAESQSSALAGDVVNTATRIRPKVSISLKLDPETQLAEPGERAAFNVTVSNSGNDIFRILLRQDGALPLGWSAHLGVEEVDLSPGVPFTFPLVVTPPNGSRAGDLATVKINAETDVGGSGGRLPGDEASAVVVVRRIHNITTPSPLDAPAMPGETLRYLLPLANGGNGNDAIELLPGAASPDWRVVADEGSLVLAVNQSADLPLRIEVPRGTPPGVTNLTLTLRLSREATQNVTIPLDVRPLALVNYTGADALRGAPGRPLTLSMVARNDGNLDGEFAFTARAPPGWTAALRPIGARLAPGESIPVTLTLQAPRDAPDGRHDVILDATLDGSTDVPPGTSGSAGSSGNRPSPAGSRVVTVDLARPDLFLADVTPSGSLARGELVLVTATVGNRGQLAAENVSVALLVDGVAVERTVLARVPVGGSAQATLSWVSTGGSDVRVVLDPDQEHATAPGPESEASVTFGSRLFPVPGPAPLLAAAAVALAALALRRRRA